MKNKISKYNIFILITLMLSLGGVLIRSILLTRYYDSAIGYYAVGTSLPAVFTVLAIVAVILFALFVLTTRKDGLEEKKFHDSSIFIFSCFLCGFVLVAMIVMSALEKNLTVLEKVAMLFSVPGALFFFTAALRGEKPQKMKTLFSLFVPLWATMKLAAIYFDSYIAVNEPNKVMQQTALISIMLFFLCECRVLIGKEKNSLHNFSGAAAIFFTSTTAIPQIFAYTAKKISGAYIACDLVLAAILIYIIVRMTVSNKKEEESENVCI